MFHRTEISGKGKGLVASRALDAGTEILQDTAAVVVISPKFRPRVCSKCFAESTNLKKCSRCKYVYYCNILCQKDHWNEHKVECQCLKKVSPKVPTDFCMLVARTLLKYCQTPVQWKNSFIPNLISHVDNIVYEKATMFNTYLQVIYEFLGNDIMTGIGFENREIIELMSKLICNTFSITNENFEDTACGIFPIASAVNHSCSPNTLAVFSGKEVALRTLSKIEALQELTISYIDTFATTKDRQSELIERYSFMCNCISCTGDKDHFMTSGRCMTTKGCDGAVDTEDTYCYCMKCKKQSLCTEGMHPEYLMNKLKTLQSNNKQHTLQLKDTVLECELSLHQWNIHLVLGYEQLFQNCIDEMEWVEALIWGQKALPGMRKYYSHNHPVLGTHLCKLDSSTVTAIYSTLERKIHSLLDHLQESQNLLEEGHQILSIAYGNSHKTVKDIADYLFQIRAQVAEQDTT